MLDLTTNSKLNKTMHNASKPITSPAMNKQHGFNFYKYYQGNWWDC